jgi:hypothetical protein
VCVCALSADVSNPAVESRHGLRRARFGAI